MAAEELAARHGLSQVGRLAPLSDYLRELWDQRFFAFALAWSRFSARNNQDRLGVLWNVLRPLLQAAIYAAVFGLVLKGSSGRPPNYAAYVTTGVFVFTFLSGSVTAGSRAITGDLGLVRTLRFPRAVLPAATTLLEIYSFLPALVVLMLVLLALGERPNVEWLLLPVAVVLAAVFALGMALLCARITSLVRDFVQLLPFMLRILFYLSGVIIDFSRLEALSDYPVVGFLIEVNPFHVYIELVRQSLLADRAPDWDSYGLGAGWAVAALLIGFVVFRQGEETYGR